MIVSKFSNVRIIVVYEVGASLQIQYVIHSDSNFYHVTVTQAPNSAPCYKHNSRLILVLPFIRCDEARSPRTTISGKFCNSDSAGDFPIWPIAVPPCTLFERHDLYRSLF